MTEVETDWASGNGHRPSSAPPGLPPRRAGRRRSMITLVVIVLAVPAAFVVRQVTDDGWRTVTTAAALEEREVIYLPQAGVFLVHVEQGPLAFRARSPHIGHRAVYCPRNGTFVEPHGSTWDRQGRYVDGPADRGLDRVAVRVRDGSVEINTTVVERGPGREVLGTPPPGGPYCRVPGPEDPLGFAAEADDFA